jgi:hypothetical protein
MRAPTARGTHISWLATRSMLRRQRSPSALNKPANSGISIARRLSIGESVLGGTQCNVAKPMSKTANERYRRIDEVSKIFAEFEDNFTLQETPRGLSS